MKKTVFNEGDTIHFMDENKPKSGEVIGVQMRRGKGEGLHDRFELKKGEIEIKYQIEGNWYGVKEEDSFASLEEMRDSIFANV